MKKYWHYGADIQHEKGLALWKVICRPYIQDEEAWLYEGSICKQKSYVDFTSKKGGLALWREHTQEEDLCRPHIQDKEAWPCGVNIGKIISHLRQGGLAL